jgi:membrane protein required for colicin V production
MNLAVADWLIIALIVLNVVAAAMHGFFVEALGMAGLVVGYVVAAWRYQQVADWLMKYLNSQLLAQVLGFLAIFFAILLVFSLAGRIMRKLMKEVGLSGFDRFLGALLGVLKGALVVTVVLMGLTAFTPTSSFLEKSELAPYFLVVGRAAIWVAPGALQTQFRQGLDFLRHAPKDLSSKTAAGR